jgi:hypothetical protein
MRCRPGRPISSASLVAWPAPGDLFIYAKDLLVEAMAPQPGHPGARTRRPMAMLPFFWGRNRTLEGRIRERCVSYFTLRCCPGATLTRRS